MADGEAREDKDGEVVNASGAGGTKGGGGERAGYGERATGGGERVPYLVPVNDVAVFCEPSLNTWAAYDKCVVKVGVVTKGVRTAVGEEVTEV